jgi:hypothetical protein
MNWTSFRWSLFWYFPWCCAYIQHICFVALFLSVVVLLVQRPNLLIIYLLVKKKKTLASLIKIYNWVNQIIFNSKRDLNKSRTLVAEKAGHHQTRQNNNITKLTKQR